MHRQNVTKSASNSDRWEPHKETLRHQYLVERKTLKEIKLYMREHYQFEAEEREYESRLQKKWGFKKKIQKAEWQSIGHHVRKRKQEGKESEVLYNEDAIPVKKVRRETQRYSKRSDTEMVIEVTPPSPDLPPGITIRTPLLSSAAQDVDDATLIISDTMHENIRIGDGNHTVVGPQQHFIASDVEMEIDIDPVDMQAWERSTGSRNLRISREGTSTPISLSEFLNLGPLLCKTGFNTPDERVTTPTSEIEYLSMEQLWNELSIGTGQNLQLTRDLHYFRFKDLFEGLTPDQTTPWVLSRLGSPRIPQSPSQFHPTLDERRNVLAQILRSTPGVAEPNIDALLQITSIPKLTSILENLIPERFAGEISNDLQVFFRPANGCSMAQLICFGLYFLSNNHISEKWTDQLLKWVIEQSPREFLKWMFKLDSITAHSFSCKLLESAIESKGDSFQLLLDLGIDKSLLAGARGGRYLQLAADNNRPDIANILIQMGADLNPKRGNKHPYNWSTFALAACCSPEVLRLLAKSGAMLPNLRFLVPYMLGSEQKAVESTKIYIEAKASLDLDDLRRGRIRSRVRDQLDEDDSEGLYGRPRCTVLDTIYLVHRNDAVYHTLLPYSQRSKVSFTVSGILTAAHEGITALSQYADCEDRKKDPRREEMLEYALCCAIDDDREKAAKPLLEFGVDPSAKSIEPHLRPLKEAASHGNLEMVELLVGYGADVNSPGVLTDATFPYAEPENHYKSFDIVCYLIDQGADVEKFGADALETAIRNTHTTICALLLDAGAGTDKQANANLRPILYASKCDPDVSDSASLELVKHFIRYGADVNATDPKHPGITALHNAAEGGNLQMVKLLLEAGASVAIDGDGSHSKTLLESPFGPWDWITEPLEIFELLLERGAKINGPQKRHCRMWNSALTLLLQCRYADVRRLELALKAGARVNELGKGNRARAPLQAAAESGNLTFVKILIEAGADINIPAAPIYGRTALQGACCHSSPQLELVRFLLEKGASVNAPAGIQGGVTALQGAAIQGHIKIVQMLLEAGTEVNAPGAIEKGRSAFEGAAEHGRLDTLQLLINAGARPALDEFDNALRFAEENNHDHIIKLLNSLRTVLYPTS